jgi:hypothetical protein
MAFTPDGLPCIGLLRPGLVIASGYNGYGGSYASIAGSVAGDIAITDTIPDLVPEEIFSPRRLLRDDPLFLTERKGLWRVATSLCHQLKAVNQQISEAVTLQQGANAATEASAAAPVARPPGENAPASGVDVEALRKFDSFHKFSRDEIQHLLGLMRRWDLAKGDIICAEGSPGGSCFVIVAGEVDVSINVRGQQQLLATLRAGNVFGQVSAIADLPRSATCSAHNDAVVLEIERSLCKELLISASPAALKFLATLNEGLISALRGADLRLMQIDQQSFVGGGPAGA